MSRERILADIRAALEHPSPPPAHHPHPAWPRAPAPTWTSLMQQFQARFEGLGGKWHAEPTPAGAVAAVARLARSLGGSVWVAEDQDGELDRLGLANGLASQGITVVRGVGDRAGADQIGLTVTVPTCAIADTGTFGLLTSGGQDRLASVIAPAHLSILNPDRVVPALADYLEIARRALVAQTSSAAILITGPSRTADIEGQLIVGVHGPREVHCLVIGGA